MVFTFYDPYSNQELACEKIFSSFTNFFSGAQIIGCEITINGSRFLGAGCRLLRKTAREVAFSEAWERYWLTRAQLIFDKADQPITSSNGFAAGPTARDAVKNSTEELYERHIVCEAWSRLSGWTLIELQDFFSLFLERSLLKMGWTARWYRIQSDLGSVTCGFIKNSAGGFLFDSCYGDSKFTERRLLMGLLKSASFDCSNTLSDLPPTALPTQHRQFYLDPKNGSILNEIKFNGTPLKISDFKNTESKVIIYQTRLPAVAMTWNKSWPPLSWGQSSIRGINQWPHPIA